MTRKNPKKLLNHYETDDPKRQRSTIQISSHTRLKLEMIGTKGENYDDIVYRLIGLYEDYMRFCQMINQKIN